MIKPRRIGHATFETPDLQKHDRLLHGGDGSCSRRARKGSRLPRHQDRPARHRRSTRPTRERCAGLSFEVAPDSDFGAHGARTRQARHHERVAQRFHSRHGSGADVSRTTRAPRSRCSRNGTISASTCRITASARSSSAMSPGCGRPAKNRPNSTPKVLGFKVSDWVDDFFVFMRCNADHHTVNFVRGTSGKMHHMAFELKDFIHLQDSCDLFGQRNIPILWGPVRHGPGHNVAIYHRNPDDQIVEFFCELDQMMDEELGYFDPRPWHRDTPQRPKTWTRGQTTIWGPPPLQEFMRGERGLGGRRGSPPRQFLLLAIEPFHSRHGVFRRARAEHHVAQFLRHAAGVIRTRHRCAP